MFTVWNKYGKPRLYGLGETDREKSEKPQCRINLIVTSIYQYIRSRRDHMVVGFTKVASSNRDVVETTLCDKVCQ